MPQLIVRNIEEKVVRKLRLRAAADGVSMEEEHRRILRAALLGHLKPGTTFADYLLAIPQATSDEPPGLFERQRDLPREIEL
ncbi:MAG: DNA-binding protein [Verrucomicrobiota bacterium]